jgi:hypothetical protein
LSKRIDLWKMPGGPDGREQVLRRVPRLLAVVPFLMWLSMPMPAHAGTITVDCATQDLQTAITGAPVGSTILVQGTCTGNFFVGEGLTLEGDPSATLDAASHGDVLDIESAQTVKLESLTIAHASGSGIFDKETGSTSGPLTLIHVTVQDNQASPAGETIAGAGIQSEVPLTIKSSTITHNTASNYGGGGYQINEFGGGILAVAGLEMSNSEVTDNTASLDSDGAAPGGAVSGGGIFAEGTVTITNSKIAGNQATVSGSVSATADGGGICLVERGQAGSLSISGSLISNNTASAISTSADETAAGGGLFTTAQSGGTVDKVSISSSKFSGNKVSSQTQGSVTASGGGTSSTTSFGLNVSKSQIIGNVISVSGGTQGEGMGGGIYNNGPTKVSLSTISGAKLTVDANGDALADGGGIDQASGPLTVTRSTIDSNRINEQSQTAVATGQAAGLDAEVPATITASTISRNSITAETFASNVGGGVGAGLVAGGSGETITNSTIANNSIKGTSTGTSGYANAAGAGVDVTFGAPLFVNSTIARNVMSGTGASVNLDGGGLFAVSYPGATPVLKATIVALNSAGGGGGPDCWGTISSQGHNLIGDPSGCSFSKTSSDKLKKDPKLGLLAKNGGPTMTMALLPGSPAVDAIPKAACAVKVDQRGVRRPQGSGCDIGAYELAQ